MRALMFGWEFPPHITGGLGTACYGLTRGLSHFGTEVIFVVPKSYGDEDKTYINLVDAGQVDITERKTKETKFWKNFRYIEVGANLIPYMDPEEENHFLIQNLKNLYYQKILSFQEATV
jgi:hypothetical protein